MGRVYTKGDLRAVLRQRATAKAARHGDRAKRERAAAIVRAIEAGEPVTVTLEELKSAGWHASIFSAADRDALHAAGFSHYVVEPDGSWSPA
jgi:hypothetical protein